MSFSQALSGLNAASSSLGTLGNNIANSQTVGFKGASTQFADVFAGSVGLGTRVSATVQNFNEGNLESTNRNLDLAISGQGFLRYEQGGEIVYSRNGQLSLTPDGTLVNAQGAQLMGYGLNAAGDVQVGGQPQVLNVPADEMPANATQNVGTTINLDSRENVGEGLSTTQVNAAGGGTEELSYHYSNNFTTYDSLGNPRNVTVYYEKAQDTHVDGAGDEYPLFEDENGDQFYFDGADYRDVATETVATGNFSPVAIPNAWNAKVVMDGYYDDANDFEVAFNNNGTLASAPQQDINFGPDSPLGNDPEPLNFELNLAGSTQFGNDSTTSALTQDGYTSGALVGITFEDNGTIMMNYANEQSRPAGQIALAYFRNPEGLQPNGDNSWTSTNASGQELVGAPGTGIFGSIESGVVEQSNVDMAKQLVDMIVSQRAYQANSQTIKTQDEILQTAINLR
ncbi:flagellar hook protein FlgE [Halomonas salipaludis]|uniref:Flagellar hook protein FlgE n=1 Tax=Halomonas salipaludis TaxID=2032625 RepID=A0A2A2F280_9GAMM|nr:flagellar hook protein FlgE [Halomonas salipaludis]PAU79038.1 flagellar hook protein FlgE [Halomonas salipaludis]